MICFDRIPRHFAALSGFDHVFALNQFRGGFRCRFYWLTRRGFGFLSDLHRRLGRRVFSTKLRLRAARGNEEEESKGSVTHRFSPWYRLFWEKKRDSLGGGLYPALGEVAHASRVRERRLLASLLNALCKSENVY